MLLRDTKRLPNKLDYWQKTGARELVVAYDLIMSRTGIFVNGA